MQKVQSTKYTVKQTIFSMGIFFAFLLFLLPHHTQASALLPGPISSCGELVVAGEYTLSTDVTAIGTSTCFVISSDNVTITGNGHTITGAGTSTSLVAIDARARTGGPTSDLAVAANGYTNLVVSNFTIAGFAKGVDASGNDNTIGDSISGGNGGDGGAVAIYYAVVGSVTTKGGGSITQGFGGTGGNLYFSDINLNISNSTLELSGGNGLNGINTNGGLSLNYTGTLNKTNVVLSALNFFNVTVNGNTTYFGAYIGGTWPIFPGNVTSCGTIAFTGTYTLTSDIGSVDAPITDSCFTIGSNNITFDGAGHTVYGSSSSNYFATVGNFSNFILASTTVTGYSNFINSSSSVTISSAGSLDLSNKYIKAGSLVISYRGPFTFASTSISALSNLTVNGRVYGSMSAGILPIGVWTASPGTASGASSFSWTGLASDASGNKIVGDTYEGGVYVSANAGATWANPLGNTNGRIFRNAASSADGTKLAISLANGHIYTSVNSGLNWTVQSGSPVINWFTMASDYSGNKLVASAQGSKMYTSTDAGVSWTLQTASPATSWYAVASSADGNKLVAVANGGYIYTSTDSGVNWATSTGTGPKGWVSIASSADGVKLAAVVLGGSIWRSIDSGLTWQENLNTTGHPWYYISSSADGTKLMAGTNNEIIWTSQDGGVTWIPFSNLPNKYYQQITSSADGNKSVSNGYNNSEWYYTALNPELKVDILNPLNNGTTTTWNPYISWGTAITCKYSYDNWVTTSDVDCAKHGSDIASPQAGFNTLAVRGTDTTGAIVTKSTTFTQTLGIIINSPSSSVIKSWSPSVNWNTTNMSTSSLDCYYSYNNFTSSTSTAVCDLGGSDITAPSTDGSYTLSVKVVIHSSGISASIGTTFSTVGWSISPNSVNGLGTVASDYTGLKLVALDGSDYAYTSIDSGVTWTPRYIASGSKPYVRIASNADGTKLAAVWEGANVYTSNDSGVTWVQRSSSPKELWHTVAISADGTKLAIAGSGNGRIYTSTDSGNTWTLQNNVGVKNWTSIAMSADGSKIFAVDAGTSWGNGYIWTSLDGGTTWTQTSSANGRYFQYITSSADGTKLAAVGWSGSVWTSTTSGATWTQTSGTSGRGWNTITSNADGTKILIGEWGGSVWVSTSSGATWVEQSSTVNGSWTSITSSADGSKITATSYNVALWNYFALNPDLKVDIILPSNNGTTTTWSPYISWGSATSCYYSWNNWTSSSTASCLNHGSDIPAPTYGSSTLYVKGIDKNSVVVSKSSAFYRSLSVNINSPTAGIVRTWAPSINWNPDNLATSTLTCTYSYDNFLTHSTSSCALGGSDITSPGLEGDFTLSVKVVDGLGNTGISKIAFSVGGWLMEPNTGGHNNRGTASSADGTKLVMAVQPGYIYTSTDSGATWVPRDSVRRWINVASSADGKKLAAVVNGGYIYTSTDSGVTWIPRGSSQSWVSISSSADGTKLVAAVYGGYIYTSTDSGRKWTQRATNKVWGWVTSNADGTKLAAVDEDWSNGYIWLSTDSGVTWNASAGTNNSSGLLSIASDSTGNKLIAVGWGGTVRMTSNGGASWSTPAGLIGTQWTIAASSADGTKLSVAGVTKAVWTSLNSGATWTEAVNTTGQGWNSLASSADGNKLVAGSDSIWTYSSLNPDLKVDILSPLASSSVPTWNPYISWGSATTCYYSWNNWTSTSTASCAGHGAEISAPAYGTSTLYVKGVDRLGTLVSKSSTFNYSHYTWYSTLSTDWNNASNWFTDAAHTISAPGVPNVNIGVSLVGSVSPLANLDTWTQPQGIDSSGLTGGALSSGFMATSSAGNCLTTDVVGNATFNSSSCNAAYISGNATFNDNSYNNIGNIGGDARFNTTYYGNASSTIFTLLGSAVWTGVVNGGVYGSDNSTIQKFVFRNSSVNSGVVNLNSEFYDRATNLGTINGDATFNDTFTFSMGTVNGTSTLNGLSQTLNGVNNVINFIKQVAGSVRDTLYFTSGSVLNISGFATILGSDANNLLTIRSTTPNSPASIGFSGTSTLDFLRIKDIYNTGSAIDLTNKTAYNDGGNSGFIFKAGATLSQLGGLASSYTAPARYVAPAPASSPSANSNNKNNNNNAGASGSVDPYFAGLVTANVGKLNLSNLPNINLSGIENNLGVSKFVNPLAGMTQLAPVGKFTPLPKLDFASRFDSFLNGSLPKSLSDLSHAVPLINKSLTSADIRSGYDLYTMKESPINTPTLSDLVKDKTKQPESLIFASANGNESSTKLMIDKKGGAYQIITVEPYAVLDIDVKNTNKVLPKASWNNIDAKVVKDKQNIIKLSVVAPKENGTYTLKVGELTLQVRVVAATAVGGGAGTSTQPKKLSPIQKLWSWFVK